MQEQESIWLWEGRVHFLFLFEVLVTQSHFCSDYCIFYWIVYGTSSYWHGSLICWEGIWTDRATTTFDCFWFGHY